MTKNMQIGQAGGRASRRARSTTYARFAYEMPAGNFFQVKIGGLTGTNELHDRPVEHRDGGRGVRCTPTSRRPRRRRTRCCPAAREEDEVRAEPEGRLPRRPERERPARRGGEHELPARPEGLPRDPAARGLPGERAGPLEPLVPDPDLLPGQGRRRKLAAQAVSALFNSADVERMPRNNELRILANGAMLTVVVGQTFSGKLTPTPVDRTPPQAAAVTCGPAKSETLPVGAAGAPRGRSASRFRSRP